MIKKLKDSVAFIAGDLTEIQELIHPKNDFLNLPYSLAMASLPLGKSSLPHRLKSNELYFILEGNGEMHIEDAVFHVEKGDTINIPPNALQWIRNTGPGTLKFLCIVSPPWSGEDEYIENLR